MSEQSANELLTEGLEILDIPFNEGQINQFIIYLAELKKWNRAYNLTGLKTDREIIIKHFLDSLLFAKALPPEASTLADIGSGAGFPGMPIKIICPDLSVFLVEPTRKKAVFLQHICSKLQIKKVEIIDKRLEEIKGLQVDVAVTRALFSVREFIERTKDILNSKGILILSKGPKFEEELNGLEAYDIAVREYRLPFEDVVRYLVIIK